MKRKLMLWVAAALMCWGASPALAQTDNAPIVVVSVSSFDQLLLDLKGQAGLMGVAEQFKQVEAMSNALTTGIDRNKPWGAAVTFDGQQPKVVAFVPVTNLEQALGGLVLFQIPVEDVDGMKRVQGAYIKEQDGYAFISDKPENFQNLPDPAKVLGKLPTQYNLAIAVNAQNVPADARELGLGLIRQGAEAGMEKLPDETDAQHAMRLKLAEQQMKAVEQVLNELDQFVMGLSMDRTAKQLALDFTFTAVRGSKMAAQFAQLMKSTTKFSGVLRPDALMSMNVSSETTDREQIEQAVAQIAVYKQAVAQAIDDSEDFDSDDERDLVKGWAAQAMDIFQKTIESGRFDMAGSFYRTPAGPTMMLAGVHVAEGKALDGLVQQVLKMAEKQAKGDDKPTIVYNAAEHAGVNLHSIELPKPKNEVEKFEKLLGAKPMIYLGFSNDSAWVALGTGSLDALKTAVDAAGRVQPTIPGQFSVALGPVLQLAAEMDTENPLVAQMANAIQPGKDHIRMLIEPIENGERMRLVIEEEVLKLIGEGVKLQQQMQRQPPPELGDDF